METVLFDIIMFGIYLLLGVVLLCVYLLIVVSFVYLISYLYDRRRTRGRRPDLPLPPAEEHKITPKYISGPISHEDMGVSREVFERMKRAGEDWNPIETPVCSEDGPSMIELMKMFNNKTPPDHCERCLAAYEEFFNPVDPETVDKVMNLLPEMDEE